MISIVYFAYIRPIGIWQDIIYNHINILRSSGLYNIAEIHIHITSIEKQYIDLCKKYAKSILPNANITTSSINQFEYPGIKKVWSLAKKNPNPDHIILYFHSKGMSYDTEELRYTHPNVVIEHSILPWQKILSIFQAYPSVNKVGLAPAALGWIWLNFWWARASYLIRCEEPNFIFSRHYYESWLGTLSDTPHMATATDTYNLGNDTIGTFYDPLQVGALLHRLSGKDKKISPKRKRIKKKKASIQKKKRKAVKKNAQKKKRKKFWEKKKQKFKLKHKSF